MRFFPVAAPDTEATAAMAFHGSELELVPRLLCSTSFSPARSCAGTRTHLNDLHAAMSFEEAICKFAADIAAASPALLMKAVEALARSRRACSAADALIHLFLGTFYLIFAALLFDLVAARVCRDCAARLALSEIANYVFIASLVLSVPAFLLFFLRAAGSASELAEGLIMKDLRERHSSVSERLQSPLLSAAGCLFSGGSWLAFIWWILQLCGLFPEIADLLLDAYSLCIMSCFALIYIRAGMALRRMNPRPSDIIVADHAVSPTQDFELAAAR